MHTEDRLEVAIAILHQDSTFLMQLRDNTPGILYPGHWGLFGGHIEPGESAEIAIQRELSEEIGYIPPVLTPFNRYEDARVVRHVFQGAIAASLDELVLGEGWDMGWLTYEDIQRGDHYSAKANQWCPIGKPHQKMLLDFIHRSH